jgi:hypothetical protein
VCVCVGGRGIGFRLEKGVLGGRVFFFWMLTRKSAIRQQTLM